MLRVGPGGYCGLCGGLKRVQGPLGDFRGDGVDWVEDVGDDGRVRYYGGGGEVALGMDRKGGEAAAVSEVRGDVRSTDYAFAANGPREGVESVARTYLLMNEVLCHPGGDQTYWVRIVETLQGHKCHEESLAPLLAMVGDRKQIGMRHSSQHHPL